MIKEQDYFTRKSYTVRDYKAIVEYCKTPKHIQEICAHFGFNKKGFYPHIAIRMNELMTESRGKETPYRTYYQSREGITDQQILELFKTFFPLSDLLQNGK